MESNAQGYPIGETRTVQPDHMTGDEFTYVNHTPGEAITTDPFAASDKAWYHPITAQGI